MRSCRRTKESSSCDKDMNSVSNNIDTNISKTDVAKRTTAPIRQSIAIRIRTPITVGTTVVTAAIGTTSVCRPSFRASGSCGLGFRPSVSGGPCKNPQLRPKAPSLLGEAGLWNRETCNLVVLSCVPEMSSRLL